MGFPRRRAIVQSEARPCTPEAPARFLSLGVRAGRREDLGRAPQRFAISIVRRISTAVALVVAVACALPATGHQLPATSLTPVDKLVAAQPSDVGMSNALGATLDSIMAVGLKEHAAPGATLAVGRYGRLVHLKAYGRLDTAIASSPVDVNTIYDMASLTKVIATTTAAMMPEEQGQLDLDRTVASYLPEFNAPDKAAITMRMVMTHRGGLEAFAALYKTFKGREQYL